MRLGSLLAVCTAAAAIAAVSSSPLLAHAAEGAAHSGEQSLAARARRFPPLTSARATFEQEREVSLVDEVLRASGVIAFRAPDHMRLELTAPEPLTIAVDGETLTVLDKHGTPIVVPPEFSGFARFGRVMNDLMLGGKGPAQLREDWQGPDAVTLVTEDPAAPFTDIVLRFPPDGRLPTEVVFRERGGDRTTIRMRALPEAAATAAKPPS